MTSLNNEMETIEGIIRRIVREELRAALTAPPAPVPSNPGHTVLISIEELAEQLQVSVKSIYNLRSTGDPSRLPPSLTVGRRLRWRQADVDAWMDAQH